MLPFPWTAAVLVGLVGTSPSFAAASAGPRPVEAPAKPEVAIDDLSDALGGDEECSADPRDKDACTLSALQLRAKKVANEGAAATEAGDAGPTLGASASACYSTHASYSLDWKAEGDDFFNHFTFVTQDDVHGAHQFTSEQQARMFRVISTNGGSAQLRYGPLRTPSYPGEAYKRYAVNLHTSKAWNPEQGFLAVMHYSHLPYGCGIWPSFWAMNSNEVWPKGGELDIMEYANMEKNKVSFHTAEKCNLNPQKADMCAPRGETGVHSYACETSYFEGKLGCMPKQLQPDGKWFADHPGVIAAEWTKDGITVFHISEADIPQDLKSDMPRPDSWSRFVIAHLPLDHGCMSAIGPQELVINMQLCGDWAGATWDKGECVNTGYWTGHGCQAGLSSTADCCTQYVTSPLREWQLTHQAYWDIKYLKVFTANGATGQDSGTFLRDGVPLEPDPPAAAAQ